jgi:hypothetical protein
MSTGQIDFVDWLNVEDAKTISELKDYAKYSVEKKRLREIYAQSLNAAAAEERAAMMAQSQQDAKLVEMQGGIEKQKTANTGKVATAMVNKDYSPDCGFRSRLTSARAARWRSSTAGRWNAA